MLWHGPLELKEGVVGREFRLADLSNSNPQTIFPTAEFFGHVDFLERVKGWTVAGPVQWLWLVAFLLCDQSRRRSNTASVTHCVLGNSPVGHFRFAVFSLSTAEKIDCFPRRKLRFRY